jgi:NAD(P)-dependent dehydrogenase (short-subunit alcohol dehydrogenase family)
MKTLLITGASSGIGKATAVEAAQQGWKVIACGRNQARLAEMRTRHSNIETLAFDITNKGECQGALDTLRIDVVILNAGTCEYVDVDEWDVELFKRVFDANFFGAVNCLQALLPHLRRGNQLVFIDSLARMLPFTRSQAYGASKAALFYLAKSLDVDLKHKGVCVQTISPGFVKTPLTDKNQFDMPMQISAEQAAKAVMKNVTKKTKTGYFPKLFAGIIRLLSSMPMSWQTALCRRLKQQHSA